VCVLLQCASVCVCGTGVRKLRPPWCQCTYKSLQHNPLQHTTHCNTQFTARLCEDTVDSTNVAPHMSRSRRRAGRLQDMRVACVMRHASHASASKTCVCIWSVSCAHCAHDTDDRQAAKDCVVCTVCTRHRPDAQPVFRCLSIVCTLPPPFRVWSTQWLHR